MNITILGFLSYCLSCVAVAEPPVQETLAAEGEPSFAELASCWGRLLDTLEEKSTSAAMLLREARLGESEIPGEFLILVHDEVGFSQLQKPHRADAIAELARSLTGSSWTMRIELAELSEEEEPVAAEEPAAASQCSTIGVTSTSRSS